VLGIYEITGELKSRTALGIYAAHEITGELKSRTALHIYAAHEITGELKSRTVLDNYADHEITRELESRPALHICAAHEITRELESRRALHIYANHEITRELKSRRCWTITQNTRFTREPPNSRPALGQWRLGWWICLHGIQSKCGKASAPSSKGAWLLAPCGSLSLSLCVSYGVAPLWRSLLSNIEATGITTTTKGKLYLCSVCIGSKVFICSLSATLTGGSVLHSVGQH
jgi:hypothetical protein